MTYPIIAVEKADKLMMVQKSSKKFTVLAEQDDAAKFEVVLRLLQKLIAVLESIFAKLELERNHISIIPLWLTLLNPL
ncbi:MAG TPA: hypothetical protein DDZ89_16215 [Clostridiales bacterium]|nr:hypothetical protein [Clostridiales bacterium]